MAAEKFNILMRAEAKALIPIDFFLREVIFLEKPRRFFGAQKKGTFELLFHEVNLSPTTSFFSDEPRFE